MGLKKGILIALCTIWAAVLIYSFGFSGKGASLPQRGAGEGVPVLRLDLLEKPRPPYRDIKKDIFTPASPHFARTAPPAEKPTPSVQTPAPPPPPSALALFAADLRFIGFVEKGTGKTVFLAKGGDVFLVRKSDLVSGRFRVIEITDTQLVFKDEETAEETRVSLAR